jgi:hypothetical protein
MEVQYIRDINGNIAFAVVPIDIWENLASQTMSSYASEPDVAYVKSQKEVKKEFNPDDFVGCISINMSNEQMFEELNQLRSEWDRDFR